MTTSPLVFPVPDPAVYTAYRELIVDLDRRMAQLTASRFQGVLKCRAGCDSCCIRFSVLPLEAALVAQAREKADMPDDDGKESCRLLAKGRCQIYPVRPIICRAQGLPLGYIDELTGSIEVSACPLNFPAEYPLVFDDLLLMDEFNQRLVELNASYCLKAKLDPGRRITLEACCAR